MNLKDIIQWDIINWSNALNFWTPYIEQKGPKLKCLELGSNQGGLSLWLALKGHDVICSDLINPENNSRELHQKYPVRNAITYQAIDASDIPYDNHFDIIIFKSILGGIGHNDNKEIQIKVISEIYKALKPGGCLLFSENLTGTLLHRLSRKLFVRWGSSWRYITLDEAKQFLSPFSVNHFEVKGFLGAFGRSEKQRNFLGTLDGIFFNHVTPQRWKYIIYGVAKK